VKLLRGFFADVGLWGLAVVFGWAIWYVVREDLNETLRRDIQVDFFTEPGLDVNPRSQHVTVEVQGPRRAVDAFRATLSPKIVRRITLADLPPGIDEARLDFAKDDFDFSEAFGGAPLTVVEMKQPTIAVRVFRVDTREITVAPPEFQGEAELGMKHALLDYTNKAKVRGAVTALSGFREIRTFVPRERLMAAAQAMRDEARSTQRIQLEIDALQREQLTLVEPRELSAHVELSRVARQELLLPVAILEDASRGASRRRLQFAEINKPFFVGGQRPQDQRNGDVPIHVADLPPGVALAEDYSVYVEEGR
jgi:hypothetical protein